MHKINPRTDECINVMQTIREQRKLDAQLLTSLCFILGLMVQATGALAVNFNITLASLTNHNTSAYPAYNQANFATNFGTTSWVNPNGQTIPVDPSKMDRSLNPVTPGHVSKTDVHTLIPSRPDLRWFAHATPWFGTSSHPKIGLTNDSDAYVASMVTDMKNRGFNGVVINWYGKGDVTDNVTVRLKRYLAGLTNNTFTYILMLDKGTHGGLSVSNLEFQIHYCQTNYFTDANYEKEPVSTGKPILMFFAVRSVVGATGMSQIKSDLGGNMVWVEQGTSYLSESWEDQSFQWADPYDNGVNPSDPFNLGAVTSQFTTIRNAGKPAFAAMCAAFNGTLTYSTSWSMGKYLPSSNGLCMIQRAAAIDSHMITNFTRMQWVTWSDWQEGSQVETGIENWVAVNPHLNGSTLSWTITDGEPTAIDHYEIYASTNSTTAALLASVPTTVTQTNLDSIGLAPGTYSIYVDAIGLPCVRDHMSPPVSFTSSQVAFNPTDYSRSMKITFAGYNRATAVSNFPALVELSTSLAGFDYNQFMSPVANDLRFTDANGNVLNHEINHWNTNGVSTVWVNVPLIASSADYIIAYWGNRADTSPPASTTNGSVWPSFSTTLHLEENRFPYADSTTLHPATSGIAPAQTVSGLIGDAQTFNGSSQYLVPSGTINLGNQFSLSAWINLDSTANNIQTIWANKAAGATADGIALFVNTFNTTDGKLLLETGNGVNGALATTAVGAVPAGGWHQVFATVDRGAGTATLYVDGANATSGGNGARTDFANDNTFNLGRYTSGSWYLKGTIDEPRIEPLRSADWVWATWMNVASNSLLASYGPVTLTKVLDQDAFTSAMKFFVSGYTRGTTLTSFPLLVNFNTGITGFSYSQFASPVGNDLRFTDASGQILCPYEIDNWNTSGTSTVWVLVPSISSSSNYIVAYWGNPALTNQASFTTNGATWTNFSGVFHLEETGFPYADGTTLHPATTGVAPVRTASGKIANAQVFNGSSQYLVPSGTVNLGNQFSLSAWVNIDPTASNIQTIWANKAAGATANGIALFVNTFNTTDGKLLLETGNGVNGALATTATGAVPAGGWHQVFATVDRGAGAATLYVDGANATSGGNGVRTDFANNNVFNLGRYTSGSWYFKGTIDEPRIEPFRSPDWVWATWMNAASYSAFVTPSSVAAPAVLLGPPPQPPVLGMTTGASGLLFNWPGQSSQFKLYSTTSLISPVQWTPVTNYTVLPDGQVQVPISTDAGTATFYRLQSN
jgi:hypothetical protein